jgi:hypothetical protein
LRSPTSATFPGPDGRRSTALGALGEATSDASSGRRRFGVTAAAPGEGPSLLELLDARHTSCMGPTCPHCGAIYEWTCGELEEHVTAPKVYFCQECRGLFVLSSEEIEDLQARFRPALEEASNEPVDLGEIEPPLRDSSDGDVAFPSLGSSSTPDAPRARDSREGQQQQWSPRDSASEAAPVEAAPLAPRERVDIIAGPHEGLCGEVAVIAGDLVVVRVGKSVIRVLAVHVRRA